MALIFIVILAVVILVLLAVAAVHIEKNKDDGTREDINQQK